MLSINQIENYILKIIYFYIFYKVYRFSYWLYSILLRKRKNFKSLYGEKTWAVVTGATDGIGKAFAHSLAKEGFNIIQISRSKEKLKNCEDELKNSVSRINVISIEYDFSKNVDLKLYETKIFSVLSNYDVSILVNNVGMGEPGAYGDLSIDEIYNTSIVNMLPQALLSRFFIKKFLERDKKSALITVGSNSSSKPHPYFSLYSATKVFNDYLSRGVEHEIKDKIDFLLVRPMGVSTNLIKLERNPFIIDAFQCSEWSLDKLGYETETYGHWNHDIQGYIYYLIPQVVFNNIDYSKLMKANKKASVLVKFKES